MESLEDQRISYILNICTKLEELNALQDISQKFKPVFFAAGVHPCNMENLEITTLGPSLQPYLAHPKCIALGETGLDYYDSVKFVEKQKKSLITHVELSLEHNIPLVIHARSMENNLSCEEDLLELLRFYKPKGVLHCFTGSHRFFEQLLNLDFYISFSGIVTFKAAKNLHHLASIVPLDKFLIETDAPFLAPTPHRGKTNNPCYVKFVAEHIAKLKNLPIEDIAKYSFNNFFTLFTKALVGLTNNTT